MDPGDGQASVSPLAATGFASLAMPTFCKMFRAFRTFVSTKSTGVQSAVSTNTFGKTNGKTSFEALLLVLLLLLDELHKSTGGLLLAGASIVKPFLPSRHG